MDRLLAFCVIKLKLRQTAIAQSQFATAKSEQHTFSIENHTWISHFHSRSGSHSFAWVIFLRFLLWWWWTAGDSIVFYRSQSIEHYKVKRAAWKSVSKTGRTWVPEEPCVIGLSAMHSQLVCTRRHFLPEHWFLFHLLFNTINWRSIKLASCFSIQTILKWVTVVLLRDDKQVGLSA